MSQGNQIKLKTSCVMSIPLHNYQNDFTFIVNGDQFQTSRLISELISPKICQIHSVDPTIETFTINTKNKGDFSHILKLIDFNDHSIPENNVEFIAEVIEQLGNESFKITISNQGTKITKDNVIQLLKQHERYPSFFSENISKEIDFISSNFYILSKSEEMKNISQTAIERIINNPKLRLEDEDQLLTFINNLYKRDKENCELYQYVNFSNISVSKIQDFLSIFNVFDINQTKWNSLSMRLQHEIIIDENDSNSERYFEKKITFKKENNNEFNGIIRHLLKKSNGDIKKEMIITSSSVDDTSHTPYCSISFDKKSDYFASKNEKNQWICFDFKDHKVSPTDYTIRSYNNGSYHTKSWNIEGSNDGKEFQIIDTQKNCSYLNGSSFAYTFKIQNKPKNSFRYIRFYQTGSNWYDNDCLRINSFEIYGDFFSTLKAK